MTGKRLQRTLLVGLGQAAAPIVAQALAGLADEFGPVGLVAGLAFVPEQVACEQIALPQAANLAELADRAGRLIRDISQLSHLPHLAQQGVSLQHPDELHLIIVADLAQPELPAVLDPLLDELTDLVSLHQVGHPSLSGVLALVSPVETDQTPAAGTQAQPPTEPDFLGQIPWRRFDRGCFLAGPTNEQGLLIGQAGELEQRLVDFVGLLLRQTIALEPEWASAGESGPMVFGLASLTWPGVELVELGSRYWSHSLLASLLSLPPDAPNLAGQARQAARQWLTARNLVPPEVLSRLASAIALPPPDLIRWVTDSLWPWHNMTSAQQIEAAAQHWQTGWHERQPQGEAVFATIEAAWLAEADRWPAAYPAAAPMGAVVQVQSRLAAVSELLHAFEEGVSQKLAEAEADLTRAEQQLQQARTTLAEQLRLLPAAPLVALLKWSWRPLRWLSYWEHCRAAQADLQKLSQVSRAQLLALQAVWLYEETLPFYQRLRAAWQEIVAGWEITCQAVRGATQAITPVEPAAFAHCLLATGGPWPETAAFEILATAALEQDNRVWKQAGPVLDWWATGLTANQLTSRWLTVTAQALQPYFIVDADQAVVRYLADQAAQTEWLTRWLEQAAPFWWRDETASADTGRLPAYRRHWLLLPGGEHSPLAAAANQIVPPLACLPSHNRHTLTAVTIRSLPEAAEIHSYL